MSYRNPGCARKVSVLFLFPIPVRIIVPAEVFASQTLVVNTIRKHCGLWISELHKEYTQQTVHIKYQIF